MKIVCPIYHYGKPIRVYKLYVWCMACRLLILNQNSHEEQPSYTYSDFRSKPVNATSNA